MHTYQHGYKPASMPHPPERVLRRLVWSCSRSGCQRWRLLTGSHSNEPPRTHGRRGRVDTGRLVELQSLQAAHNYRGLLILNSCSILGIAIYNRLGLGPRLGVLLCTLFNIPIDVCKWSSKKKLFHSTETSLVDSTSRKRYRGWILNGWLQLTFPSRA